MGVKITFVAVGSILQEHHTYMSEDPEAMGGAVAKGHDNAIGYYA